MVFFAFRVVGWMRGLGICGRHFCFRKGNPRVCVYCPSSVEVFVHRKARSVLSGACCRRRRSLAEPTSPPQFFHLGWER